MGQGEMELTSAPRASRRLGFPRSSAHVGPGMAGGSESRLKTRARPGAFSRSPSAVILDYMPGWYAKLTRPVAIKGGPVLRTLNDARSFMIDHLPE